MTWLLLALLAPLCFALVNHIDEHLVRRVSTPGALVLFSGLFGFVTAIVSIIIVYGTGHNLATSPVAIAALMFSGGIDVIWFLLYLKAIETENISSVVPWFQLVPVFTAILSTVFLHEILGMTEIIAGILIIIGASILSFDWSESFRFKRREVTLMVGASILISIGALIFKAFAIEEPSFWIAWFWNALGMAIGATFFLLKNSYRKDFVRLVKTSTGKVLGLNLTNEALNGIGQLAISYASLLVPLAYVSTISSIQPVFVVMIALGTAAYAKDWKQFNLSTLLPLLIALAFIITGAVLFARVSP